MYTVGVVGLGYVGLCSAVCMARRMKVIGLDADKARIRALKAGRTAINEEGLKELLGNGLRSGRIIFTTNYGALADSDFVFLSVGTPSLKSGRIDLQQVEAAARSLGQAIRRTSHYLVVVVKSTVVPGTMEGLVTRVLEKNSGKKAGRQFGVCSNPEFLREGSAVADTLNPDRIVIGSSRRRDSRALEIFWRRFYGSRTPAVVTTDPWTAELVKYSSNAFLATKVSFINFIARVCEVLPSSNVDVVARAMGLDARIGARFLDAGPGYGGSCFPKDVKALIEFVEGLGLDSSILRSTDRLNETQPEHVLSLARASLGTLAGRRVAILGVAFKEGTGDVRESRGIRLAQLLIGQGSKVGVSDPLALDEARRVLGSKAEYHPTALGCISGTDLAIVVNSEPEFRRLRPADFIKKMRRPRVLDTRRIYDPERFKGKVLLDQLGRGRRVE